MHKHFDLFLASLPLLIFIRIIFSVNIKILHESRIRSFAMRVSNQSLHDNQFH